MAKILIVEDDVNTCMNLKEWLSRERHTVDHSHSGVEGLELLMRFGYDLAILDWNLPDMEGPEICRAVLEKKKDFPILFLTSRFELADRLSGLDAGAFDYVIKPSTLEEISPRVKALLRRVQPESISDCIKLGNLEIRRKALDLGVGEKRLQLSQIEADIMIILSENLNAPLSSQQILQTLWPGKPVSKELVKVHIMNLRKKLAATECSVTIVTSKSGGYFLKLSDEI